MHIFPIYATISAVLVAASWAQGGVPDEGLSQQDAEPVGDCSDEQWADLQVGGTKSTCYRLLTATPKCPFSQSCCIFSTFFVLQVPACCETVGDNCCGSEARYYDEFYACTPEDDPKGDFVSVEDDGGFLSHGQSSY